MIRWESECVSVVSMWILLNKKNIQWMNELCKRKEIEKERKGGRERQKEIIRPFWMELIFTCACTHCLSAITYIFLLVLWILRFILTLIINTICLNSSISFNSYDYCLAFDFFFVIVYSFSFASKWYGKKSERKRNRKIYSKSIWFYGHIRSVRVYTIIVTSLCVYDITKKITCEISKSSSWSLDFFYLIKSGRSP